MTHICISKQTIIGSDNGLSPGRRQAIIWTNAGILLIGPLGTNFSEISIKIVIFSLTKMCLKVSSPKWRPVCLGLNVLINMSIIMWHVKGSCFLLGFLSSPLAPLNTYTLLNKVRTTWALLNIPTVFPGMGISIIKIRWPWNHLIFHGNSYTGETASLDWEGPLCIYTMLQTRCLVFCRARWY